MFLVDTRSQQNFCPGSIHRKPHFSGKHLVMTSSKSSYSLNEDFNFLPFDRHFLKKNRSIERLPDSSTDSSSSASRKWVSDECLPRQRTQSCSDTMGNSRAEKEEHAAQPCRERPERKPLLPNRELSFRKQDQSSVILKSPVGTVPSKENIYGPQTDKTSSHLETETDAAESKPEIIKKAHSVGPNIKTALSKVFKKLPAGGNGPQGTSISGRLAGKVQWRQRRDRSLKDTRMSLDKCTVKSAVSCEELDQRDLFEHVVPRRWHSTEALMNKTSRWVGRQQGLSRWEEEPEDKNEVTSDCESLFSLDSLSSAYATALAEQLKHEEAVYSEAESEDSCMSKDSLIVDRSATNVASQKKMVLAYSQVPSGSYLSMQNGWVTVQTRSADSLRIYPDSPSPQQPILCKGADNNSSPRLSSSSLSATQGRPRSCSPTSPCSEDRVAKGQENGVENPKNTPVTLNFQDCEFLTQNADLKDVACQAEHSERLKENVSSAPTASMEFRSMGLATLPAVETARVASDIHPTENASSEKLHPVSWNAQDVISDTTMSSNAVLSQPVMAFPTSAADQDMWDQMCDVSVPPKSSGETEMLCSSDGAGGLNSTQECDFRNSENGIFPKKNLADVVESTEQHMKLHQEPVRATSRKRNKEQLDVSGSSLKIPKRSNGSKGLTPCSLPPASQQQTWQDSNNNLSDLKKEEPSLCVGGGEGRGTSEPERKEQNVQTIGAPEGRDTSCQGDTSADQKISDRQDARLTVSGDSKEQGPHIDKHMENQQRTQHICKSDAICSAIDLRISQMVKEHIRLSLSVNDDGKKSRNDSTDPSSSPACFFGCHEELRVDERKGNPIAAQHHSEEELIGGSTPVKSEHFASDLPVRKKNGGGSSALKPPEAAQRLDRAQNSSVVMSDMTEINGNIATKMIQSNPANQEGSDPSGASAAGSDSSSAGRQRFTSDSSTPEKDTFFQEAEDYHKGRAPQTCLTKDDPQIQPQPASVSANCSDIHLKLSPSLRDSKGGCGRNCVTDAASSFHCCSLTLRMIQNFQDSPGSCPCTATSLSLPGGNLRHQQNTSACENLNGFALLSDWNHSCGLEPTPTGKPAQNRFSCPQSHCNNSAEAHVNSNKCERKCHKCESNICKEASACHREEQKVKHEGRICGSVQKTPGSLTNHTRGPVASRQCRLNPPDDQLVSAVSSKKVKRFRRSQIQTQPPSSSESSLKSSDEDEADTATRVPHTRLPTCVTPHSGKQPIRQDRNADDSAPVSLTPSKIKSCNQAKNSIQTRHSLPPQAMSRKAAVDKNALCSRKVEDQHPPKTPDSLLRFASSDINPFVHQWQDGDTNQACCKSPAFGSAADLTCGSPLLNSAEKRISRCCSVDNGLNGQNSPFNSHLSTYATKKGLSSTLSSEEECKDRRPELTQAPAGPHSQLTVACSSSSNEMVFVYSSEQESAENSTLEAKAVCHHATQTERLLPGQQERHRRSKTAEAAARKTNIRRSPTWASMENMSAHLSKLIDSTSDLLEDVQEMRSGEGSKARARRSGSLRNAGESSQREGSTQTAVDVGIQTQGPTEPAHKMVAMERPRPHEISLIVKVVGQEVVSVSQGVNAEQVTPAAARRSGTSIPDDRPFKAASAPSPPEEPWPKNAAVFKNPLLPFKQQATFTDRASSPILTVGPRTHLKRRETLTKQRAKEPVAMSSGKLSTSSFSEDDQTPKRESDGSSSKPEPVPLERVGEVSTLFSGTSSVGFGFPVGGHTDAERSSSRISPILTSGELSKAGRAGERGYNCIHSYHPSPVSDGQLQEDDVCSLAPSECNTDVLVNIRPIAGASPCWDQQLVPENLPLHNKFKNWSGISHQRSQQPGNPTKDSGGYGARTEALTQGDRTREIQRLRQEREQVMATVGLGLSPTSLTVELTEAKLHYGLGETDALLKVLTRRPPEELEAPTKHHLYER